MSLIIVNASFHLDAQSLGAMEAMGGSDSTSRKSIASPAFMCPASPASSFSGSNGPFSADEVMSSGNQDQLEDEEVDGTTADAHNESVVPLHVSRENNELVKQGDTSVLDVSEEGTAYHAVEEPVAGAAFHEMQGHCSVESDVSITRLQPDAGTDQCVADMDAHLDTGTKEEQEESKGDDGVGEDQSVVNTNATTIVQMPEDDSKKIGIVHEEEPTSSNDKAIELAALDENLSFFPGEVQEREATSDAVTKQRSMIGHMEDNPSPSSRHMSFNNESLPQPPLDVVAEGYASDGVMSAVSSSSQAEAVVVSPQFPSTPLAAASQKPRTGQPMRTPVPSPTGSLKSLAADSSNSGVPAVDDTEIGLECTSATGHRVQKKDIDGGGPEAEVRVSALLLADTNEDERLLQIGEQDEDEAVRSGLSLQVRGRNRWVSLSDEY